jgi:hypothetical protein
MTFLTFRSTNLLDSNTIKLLILHVLMELLIDAVKFIFGELHLAFPVTVNTPTHA